MSIMAAGSRDRAAFYFTSSVTPNGIRWMPFSIYASCLLEKTNHALSDVVPAHCPVSRIAGFYSKERGNSNPALLFRLRMAGTINIDYPAVVRLRPRNRRDVLPRKNLPAKARNYDSQKKVLLAGGTWINTRTIFR